MQHRNNCTLFISATPEPTAHHFAKVIDEVRRRQQVHRRQVVGAGGVVMVAVDGEHRQAHVQVGVLKVGAPAARAWTAAEHGLSSRPSSPSHAIRGA
jgi:hypothetical protein